MTANQCPPSIPHQTPSAVFARGASHRALRVRAGSPTRRPSSPTLGSVSIPKDWIKLKKQVLVSVDRAETRVALLEASGTPAASRSSAAARKAASGRKRGGGPEAGYRVAELYIERRGGRSIVGNIYKGKVDNVLPGLEAAFVDIGLEKNGFLHVDEIVLPGVETPKRGRGGGRRAQDLRPAQTRPGDRRAGRQGPAEDQGRAPVDGADDRRALHGLRAHRRGRRRLPAPGGQGARTPAPPDREPADSTAAA